MDTINWIKKTCKEKGISVTFLCKKIGVSPHFLLDLKKANREVPKEKLVAIADVLNVSVDCLLNGHPPEVAPTTENKKAHRKGVRIPVYGKIAAGIPIDAVEDIEDWEEIDEEMAAGGDYIALRIKGDSMAPRIFDGDVVIIRKQDDLEDGDTGAFIINGNDATCKKIKKMPKGIMLISTNPAYDPMFFSPYEIAELPVRVIGKVVEQRGKL